MIAIRVVRIIINMDTVSAPTSIDWWRERVLASRHRGHEPCTDFDEDEHTRGDVDT